MSSLNPDRAIVRGIFNILEPDVSQIMTDNVGKQLHCVTDIQQLTPDEAKLIKQFLTSVPHLVHILPATSYLEKDKESEKERESNAALIQLLRVPSLRESSKKVGGQEVFIEFLIWKFYELVELAYSWELVTQQFVKEYFNFFKTNPVVYWDGDYLLIQVEMDASILRWANLVHVIDSRLSLKYFKDNLWISIHKEKVEELAQQKPVSKKKKASIFKKA